MPRDGTPARMRLRMAALALYREHGYEGTTTAQIAAHAGVTERTYFRHFADKREVLFDGEEELRTVLVDAVAAAPAGSPPLDLVIRAFRAAVPLLVRNRAEATQRAEVIARTPALRERALTKTETLIEALAGALNAREVPASTARLAAQVGMAIFEHAAGEWSGDSADELEECIDRAAGEAHALCSESPPAARPAST